MVSHKDTPLIGLSVHIHLLQRTFQAENKRPLLQTEFLGHHSLQFFNLLALVSTFTCIQKNVYVVGSLLVLCFYDLPMFQPCHSLQLFSCGLFSASTKLSGSSNRLYSLLEDACHELNFKGTQGRVRQALHLGGIRLHWGGYQSCRDCIRSQNKSAEMVISSSCTLQCAIQVCKPVVHTCILCILV